MGKLKRDFVQLAAITSVVFPACSVAAEGAESGLEEVVVTAQKREESVQRIPVAVTALDETALETRNIVNLQQVGAFSPNVRIETTRSGSGSGGPIFIRGVGQNDPITSADPGVGVYVDGVYFGRMNGSLFDLVDVERVEILRGPQGTLYGKNTIGGAVNVITQKPGSELEGSVKARLGNYDYAQVVGSANIPLSDTVYTRVSAIGERRDGYSENTLDIPGRDLDERRASAARAAIRYAPSDEFDAQLSLDWNDEHNGGRALRRVNAGTEIAQGSSDPFTASLDYPGYRNSESGGAAVHLRWNGPAFSLVSITSYRDIDEDHKVDLDAGPTNLAHQNVTYRQRQMSQEFQILGSSFEDRLNWIGGLYAFNENARYVEFDSLLGGASFLDLDVQPENTSFATFGQLDWKITDRLTGTLGLRYTYEKRQLDLRFNAFGPAYIEDTWSEPTPRLAFAYQATDAVLFYVSAAKGFKAGQFNARARSTPEYRPLDPEKVWAYEVGTKTRFLDNRVQLNIAAFYSTYEDIQLVSFAAQPNGVDFTASNAPEGKISGAELEFEARPFDGLRVQGSFGWLDARYTEYRDLAGRDLSSRKFEQTPSTTFSLAAEYTVQLAHVGSLLFATDYVQQSKIYAEATNVPQLSQQQYGLLGARIGYTLPSGNADFALWGRNLTNEEYIAQGVNLVGIVGAGSAIFGAPRTYGISATYRFD
jgi:iron complex outermembrane recepter protein